MDFDFKTVILIILIIAAILGMVYFCYRIINEPSTIEIMPETSLSDSNTISNVNNTTSNEIKKVFQNDSTDNVEEQYQSVDSEEQNTYLYGLGINLNNIYHLNDIPNYRKISSSYRYMGAGEIHYMVPDSWDSLVDAKDPVTGVDVRGNSKKLSEYTDKKYGEITYEEFLQIFIEKDRESEYNPSSVYYSLRTLNIGGIDYAIQLY